jgi:MFS transporter, UMF1 family
MRRRLNPFHALPNPLRGLPNGKEVAAWAAYDLANQSFTLLMITLLFPIYFRDVIVGDESRGDSLWSIAVAGSLLMVVVLSPLVGAFADAFGAKKRLLMATGFVCAVLTIALAITGPGTVAVAMAIFMAANLAYQLGENLLAAYLPEVSTPRTIGRVSATGWSAGYIGALVLQVVVVVMMLVFGLKDPAAWGGFFVLAGLWFVAGMIAPMIVLKESKPGRRGGEGNLVVATVTRFADTVRRAGEYRQLTRFLIAFFVYALGVQVVIAFAGLLARDFGMGDVKLMVFALQLTVTAGIGAVVTGIYQDRIGAKTTVAIFLGIWIATAAGLLALTLIPASARAANEWAFWTVGNGVGLGLGGIGTASRSMVGLFTPKQRTAEFFGLWGMAYKFAGVVGVLSFGLAKAYLPAAVSMILLLGFFVAGLVLLMRVDARAGVRQAMRGQKREDAEAGPEPT